LLAIVAIAASACSGDEPNASGPTTAMAPSSNSTVGGIDGSIAIPDQTSSFESAPITWRPCGSFECAEVAVPLDYAEGSGQASLEIAVGRIPAANPSERLGVLVVNPGGPGGSGLELLEAFAAGFFPQELDAFDIVSFDPRGVGASEPAFACGADGERLAATNDIEGDIDTAAETRIAEDAALLCVESMGAVAGLLHTEFVARDMDIIRAALGEDQISYLGYSYGSTIGTWYASLFPNRVRAMVLDGAQDPIDPSATTAERVANDILEIETFEVLLDRALSACDDASCEIFNDGDPLSLYLRATQKFDLVANELDDNPLAGPLGLITTLYSEDTWSLLYAGIAGLAIDDDPSVFASSAQFQIPNPGQVSITGHINCLDDWVVESHVDRADRINDSEVMFDEIEDQLPLLAALNFDTFDACPYYDQFAPEPLSIALDGANVPILVIGNPNDPATPFVESVGLATETLSNGYLIEVEHLQHTVYPDNACVVRLVHEVLLETTYPTDRRTTCLRED